MAIRLVSALHGAAALLATAALAACMAPGGTAGQGARHADQASGTPMQSGSGQAAGQAAGPMTGAATAGQATGSGGDMTHMCAMHREQQNTSPQQRQEMMERHMKGMSPEMRQRHLEMMRQHCK